MLLERIFIHRLIRLLRVAVPILLAALIAIPAWSQLIQQTPGEERVATAGFMGFTAAVQNERLSRTN